MIRIEKIHFKNVNFRNGIPETCGNINLLVGGNNSGKTTLLSEIHKTLTSRISGHPGDNWFLDMTLKGLESKDDINRILPKLIHHSNFCNFSEISDDLFLDSSKRVNWNDDIFELLKSPNNGGYEFNIKLSHETHPQNISNLFQFLTTGFVTFESCEKRLDMNFQTVINHITQPTENDFVLHLYKNKKMFRSIQKHIFDTFGLNIAFDNVTQGFKPIRIVKHKVNTSLKDDFKLNEEWDNKTVLLNSAGHGIRAYINLIFSIIDNTNQIIFIDEPELFIHPPQRRGLGKFITELSGKTNKQLFISTHDAEFLRGVLSVNERTTVFKLTNSNYQYNIHTIKPGDITALINKKHSNLLNERILNSFFYKRTILCENENDRVFYEEATARYHWKKFHSVNFIGFTGHHDVVKVFSKLSDLNINPIAILDIDYLRTGVLPNSINDLELTELFRQVQTLLKSLFPKNSIGYQRFKEKGIKLFSFSPYASHRQKIKLLINKLKKHQLFIVPYGELESWTGVIRKNDLSSMLSTIRSQKIESLNKFLSEILNQP